jgi:pimeloyl-ACP methyl ester carboxylesterase
MRLEPIVGRYAHLEIGGRPHRLYFEEAGEGIPLLCLHTAGSDARQYRAVLNDAEITRHFRVVAFDMPWHGRSSPPAGWHLEDYRLTTDTYTAMIMTVARSLGLERPVVMGCSIGGRNRRDRYARLPAVSAYRRVRLLGLAARHRGRGRADQRRESYDHARPGPLPDERKPRGFPRLLAPDPERGQLQGVADAKQRQQN